MPRQDKTPPDAPAKLPHKKVTRPEPNWTARVGGCMVEGYDFYGIIRQRHPARECEAVILGFPA